MGDPITKLRCRAGWF